MQSENLFGVRSSIFKISWRVGPSEADGPLEAARPASLAIRRALLGLSRAPSAISGRVPRLAKGVFALVLSSAFGMKPAPQGPVCCGRSLARDVRVRRRSKKGSSTASSACSEPPYPPSIGPEQGPFRHCRFGRSGPVDAAGLCPKGPRDSPGASASLPLAVVVFFRRISTCAHSTVATPAGNAHSTC